MSGRARHCRQLLQRSPAAPTQPSCSHAAQPPTLHAACLPPAPAGSELGPQQARIVELEAQVGALHAHVRSLEEEAGSRSSAAAGASSSAGEAAARAEAAEARARALEAEALNLGKQVALLQVSRALAGAVGTRMANTAGVAPCAGFGGSGCLRGHRHPRLPPLPRLPPPCPRRSGWGVGSTTPPPRVYCTSSTTQRRRWRGRRGTHAWRSWKARTRR